MKLEIEKQVERMLNSVMDGAKELLVHTITALAAAGINESEYIIIGG